MKEAPLDTVLDNDKVIAMESNQWCLPPEQYRNKGLNWAKVRGSDQHAPSGTELWHKYPGSHFTWVKMETPCWEELRQALLAHEVCVLDQTEEDPNKTPNIFLSSLTIKDMSHCSASPGNPLTFNFNPFFNAIIDGRGAGKSTALESIRIAARRKDQLLKDGMSKLAQDLNEFAQLTTQHGVMKTNTELVVTVERRETDYRLTWRQNEQHTREHLSEGKWVPSEVEGDLLDRFPMDIFSQKQIYTLTSAPQGLLAIIDRSPEVDKQDWQTRWDSKVSEYRELKERQRGLQAKTVNEKSLSAKLVDIKN